MHLCTKDAVKHYFVPLTTRYSEDAGVSSHSLGDYFMLLYQHFMFVITKVRDNSTFVYFCHAMLHSFNSGYSFQQKNK